MRPHIRELCIQLGQEIDQDRRRTFLAEHPELLDAHIVESLAELVRTTVRVDVPRALILAEAALAIATELGDDQALARALRAKANAMWFKGDCRAATELFSRASILFEAVGRID